MSNIWVWSSFLGFQSGEMTFSIYIYISKYICIYYVLCVCARSVAQSCLTLCDSWTVAHQAPLSMEFAGQECWSKSPLPTPGDLPYPGVKPISLCLLHWQMDSLPLLPPGKPSILIMLFFKAFMYQGYMLKYLCLRW